MVTLKNNFYYKTRKQQTDRKINFASFAQKIAKNSKFLNIMQSVSEYCDAQRFLDIKRSIVQVSSTMIPEKQKKEILKIMQECWIFF